MCLPLPKRYNNLIADSKIDMQIVQKQTISVSNEHNNSSLQIGKFENNFVYSYANENISYSMPGATFAQVSFEGKSSCFRIPLDAGTCENCTSIRLYQDSNGSDGKIQLVQNISIINSKF